MAGYPPPYPPPGPPYGYDPRSQRRFLRDQARAQRAAFRAQRAQMRYQLRGMRRGSILGPIVLIGVGIVFLLVQTGRLDHARVWDWYGHWWPFLLVAAGMVVLAEWAVDQHLMRDPQRPQYRRSFAGGIFLIFLICAVAASVFHNGPISFGSGQNNFLFPGFHFDQDSLDQLFGDKHESDQSVDLAFATGASLSVVNPNGGIIVNGTSDDNRIHIAMHKQIYASSDSDAEAKAQQFVPQVGTEPGGQNASTLTITVPTLHGARADLVLTVPPSAAISVATNRGGIQVSSMHNAVTVTANRGDIELSGIAGPVAAHLNNSGSSISARSIGGGITIQGHAQDLTLTDIEGPVTLSGDFFGTTHLERINGAIHFHTSLTDMQFARLDGETEITRSSISADQVMGPVVLTTSNRNVTLERIAGDIAVTNRNGAVNLTAAPGLGNISIEDRNGEVNATLPKNSGFQVDARTTHGDVTSGFQLSTSGSGDSKTLTGMVGAGGPMVRIVTSNSDISLNKATVAPIPAAAPAPPKITLVPPAPAAPSAHKSARKAKATATAPAANP